MDSDIAREVLHAAGRSDIVTGLRTHTHAGPPDGSCRNIARLHPSEPGDVFFCGPPGLAETVRKIAGRVGMRFHEERF